MNVWKPIDRLGYAIAKWWSPRLQVRTGVMLTLTGLGLVPYVVWSGEPPVIYEMSALALIFGGLGVIVTAVLALKEDADSSEEDLNV